MHSTTPLPASEPNKLPGGASSDCLLQRLDEILNHRPTPPELLRAPLAIPPNVFPAFAVPAKRIQREDRPVVDQLRRPVRQAFQPDLVPPRSSQQLEMRRRVDQLNAPQSPTVPPPKDAQLENEGMVDQLVSHAGRMASPHQPAPKLDIKKPVDQRVRPASHGVPTHQSGPELDIKKPVDQQLRLGDASQQCHKAVALIESRPDLFARQGSVSATWRHRNGKTFGPYYRLSYRDDGRQRAIYLGREGSLVESVRQMLHKLQEPWRLKRVFDCLEHKARAELRANNAHLAALLRPYGLRLKGYEVRGWRTSTLHQGLSPGAVGQPLGTSRGGG
jgi:hypothetical protein